MVEHPPAPHYADSAVTLFHGDCLDVLRTLPDDSIHAVVTDPPYGLEFMGREWDSFGDTRQPGHPTFKTGTGPFGRAKVRYGMAPSYDSRAAAGMSATGYTDGAERLERPSYLGGLNPKCKVCGKWQRGANPCTCEAPEFPNERRARTAAFGAWCAEWVTECLRVLKPGGHLLAFGGTRTWHRLAAAVEDAGFEIRDSIAWLYGSGFPKSRNLDGDWYGWGTALKPAFEPIVVARKPLAGTVAANVLTHGTGALNIDATRTGRAENDRTEYGRDRRLPHANTTASLGKFAEVTPYAPHDGGRWPTNVVLDDTQAAELDKQSGTSVSRVGKPRGAASGDGWGMTTTGAEYDDQGGASRFFPVFRYEAKAPSEERPRYHKSVLRLRDDLTPEQVDHVRARLAEAGVQVD